MKINKKEILKNHCYTKLVYERINKKLNSNYSNEEVKALIKKILTETDVDFYQKKGKNFYISNKEYNVRITVNSNTFRIITVDKITKPLSIISLKKEHLREIYKQKRNDLSEVEIQKFQENIYQQIFDLDFSEVKTIHIFLSLEKFKEIDTQPIIDFFREKEIKIVVSKCNFEDNTLSHFYFDKNTVLELNKFGVPEPVNSEKVDEKKLDIIFVPLLISDDKNYRVGYGKGFYDRFLSKCRKDAKIIGLNFFKPINKIEDKNKFDIALDQVIYPKN